MNELVFCYCPSHLFWMAAILPLTLFCRYVSKWSGSRMISFFRVDHLPVTSPRGRFVFRHMYEVFLFRSQVLGRHRRCIHTFVWCRLACGCHLFTSLRLSVLNCHFRAELNCMMPCMFGSGNICLDLSGGCSTGVHIAAIGRTLVAAEARKIWKCR